MPGPLAAAGLMAAGGIAEGLIGSAFSLYQQNKQNRFNRNMAGTAHQREVEDLKRAGLNPILSANKGAASPPSAGAQMAPMNATEKVAQALRLKSDLELQQAQARDLNSASGLKDAQNYDIWYTQLERNRLLQAQWRQALQQADKTDLEKLNITQQLKNLKQEEKLLLLNQSHSAYDLERARAESEFYSTPFGKAVPFGKLRELVPGLPSLRLNINRKGR